MREIITDTLILVRLSSCQYSCLIFWNIRVASLPLLLFWTYFLPAYGRRYRGEWWWCFSNWRTGWRAQPVGAGADKKRNQYPSGKNSQLSFKNWKSKVRFLAYFVEVKDILPKKKSCPLYRLNVSFLHNFFFSDFKNYFVEDGFLRSAKNLTVDEKYLLK